MMLKTIVAAVAFIGMTGTAHADCKLMEAAKLPIEMRGTRPLLQGKLRGEPVLWLVDTGGSLTMFDINVAKKAGLSVEDSAYRAVGSARGERRIQQANFDDWEIGGMKAPSRRLLLTANSGFPGFSGTLGFDFFSKFDFEINLKANEIKLFQPQGCGDSNLAYWAPDKAEIVEMLDGGANEPNLVSLHVPVKLNGAQFRAVLDTGSSWTWVGRKVAEYFGVNAVAPTKGTLLTHKFDSFELGSEMIKNPTLRLTEGFAGGVGETGSHIERRETRFADMVLGVDFMRAHRILVANSQHRVYFTYEGGQVFPVP